MTQETWTKMDDYITGHMLPEDPVLTAALADSQAAGLPAINVTPAQGRLLQLLAMGMGAHRILEIGTLGGYSTIWLARALTAGGYLITLEANPKHAEVARANLARAGLTDMVELRLGNALESLPRLAAEGAGPFDFIFIDADKPGYADYLTWAVRLARPGSLILADNVVRKGAVADPKSEDADVQGIQRFFDRLDREDRLTATAIQTVGRKGYDGFALALVGE